MLIEAASTRLAIDLLESLRKSKLNSGQIRVSYLNRNGSVTYRIFESVDSLKSFYISTYSKIVSARNNPFTTNRNKALLLPIAKNGVLIGQEPDPIKDSITQGLCEVGRFLSIESFKLTLNTFNFDVIYDCRDVSNTLQIIPNTQFDLRRQSRRQKNTQRHRRHIIDLVTIYQTILSELFRAYNASLYVEPCYVNIGYAEESILLYQLFFAITKASLNSGIRSSVLDRRYLRKVNS